MIFLEVSSFQCLKYTVEPFWHQQSWHFQNHLNHLSSANDLHHIYMPKGIEVLPSDWLIRYLS